MLNHAVLTPYASTPYFALPLRGASTYGVRARRAELRLIPELGNTATPIPSTTHLAAEQTAHLLIGGSGRQSDSTSNPRANECLVCGADIWSCSHRFTKRTTSALLLSHFDAEPTATPGGLPSGWPAVAACEAQP